MKIKILSMYPDLMNLYGSGGNVRCLERHICEAGAETEIIYADLGDEIDFSDIDFVYVGAGTERSQKRVLQDIKRHKSALWDYIDAGGVCLFCGNAFEMLGKSITDINGTVFEGLGYYDFHSVEEKRRVVVDTVCTCRELSSPVLGFMNKQSRTTFIPNPLFRVTSGAGNAPDRNDEGICYKALFATQLSGPILVRNPHFRAMIEKKIYDRKQIDLLPLYFMYEEQAYKESLKGLKAGQPV